MRLDANGRVGIGTDDTKNAMLYVEQSAADKAGGIQIGRQGGGHAWAISNVLSNLRFGMDSSGDGTVDTDVMTMDHTGIISISSTVPRGCAFYESGHSAQLQVEGTNPTDSQIAIIRNNAQYGPNLILARSCGTTVCSNTLVATGQGIGGINFQANDGTDFIQAAYIAAKVGNHAASNCMSAELQFATSDGTNGAVTERVRIAEDGKVGIGTTTPTTQLMVSGATNDTEVLRVANNPGSGGSTQGITYIGLSPWSSATHAHTRIGAIETSIASYQAHMVFETRSVDSDSEPAERMRITNDGKVGIGTASPNPNLHVIGSIGSTTHMTAQGGIYFSVAPGSEAEPTRITTAASGGGTCTLFIGNAAITVSSDRRVKNNIQCYTCSAVDVLDNARVVEFE